MVGVGRVVTLVGAGGVGKTTLAWEVARRVAGRAVRFVELAAVGDGAAVADAVVTALGLTGPLPAARALDALVVLDNCEHVIDAAAEVVASLTGGRLSLLTTSRERLGVPGEQVWVVEPLAAEPARDLFVARAEAARPGAVTPADAAVVGDLVARLDGLPLAIELAAARVATLALADLPDPLTGARRGELRHRTLRAVIDWSLALLTDAERRALHDWAVFAGAVPLADARAVVPDPQLVEALTARSLLSVQGDRYRMLRTVRAALGPPGDDVSRLHAEHFAALAARENAGLRTAGERAAHDRLEGALDELRAAHTWARAHEPALAARMSRDLHHFAVSGLHDEILGWAAGLGGPAADVTAAARLVLSGDLPDARRRATRALVSDDPVIRAHALESLSDIALFEGNVEECRAANDELRAVAEEIGDPHYLLFGQAGAALALAYAGRPDEAQELLARITTEPAAPSDRAWLAYFRGETRLESDPEAAGVYLERAIALADEAGNRYVGGVARVSATTLRARTGDPVAAAALFAGVIEHWLALASWSHLLTTLRNLTGLLARLGADEAAAELWGAVTRADLTATYGAERARLDETRRQLEKRLGQKHFEELARVGADRDVPAAARAALFAVPDQRSA